MHNTFKPGGHLLVALTNVRHAASILNNLLHEGKFKYENSVVMDWSHLRFFTRKSMLELIDSSNLELINMRGDLNGNLSRMLYVGSATLLRDLPYFSYNLLARRKSVTVG